MTQKINFGDISGGVSQLENAKVVIVPVPYDQTSTWIKGADKGPEAILEASANMELYDIETDSEVYKKGIFTAKPIEKSSTPEAMVETVKNAVASYLDKEKFTVVIGGEHSVSLGSIYAHHEKFPDIAVLGLDAHTDLRPEYQGSKFSHACVMARARELCPLVQVGIRSMDSTEKAFVDKSNIFFARDIYDNTDWHRAVLDALPEKIYITIDLDVFDPAVMPSTGTPEPGGLFWYDCLSFLKKVFENKNVLGFDVVELCPNCYNKAPDFLAAKLIYKLLSYKFRD